MAASERWYFTKEQLANTPSRDCGTDADKELSYRQQSANFIQDMGQRLQVTQLCINTAIVYMHRFYMFHPFTKFHRNSISTCALFLAAKVEEQPRKLEHVIKMAHMCLHRDGPALDPKGEAYLEQAHELVINENIMLQTLGFDIDIDHPHTYVVKCCQLVLASKDLAQTSYFMATNSLHLTTMCLQYKPTAVACLCIHLACKWSNWQIPPSSEGKEWFWYVDKAVTHQVLEELTSEFLAILDKCPSRLKRRIMSGKESQPVDKKSKMDPTSLSMNPSSIDQDSDLESFLNSKEFLDAQRDSIVINTSPASSRNNNSISSHSKPSPALSNPSVKIELNTNSLSVSSPVQPLLSPSKKRAESITLATYREKKDQKRRPDLPLPNKEHHPHNSHWKLEAETAALKAQQHHHHSAHPLQEPSGDSRHKSRGHSEGFGADEKASKVRVHHHHHHHHHNRGIVDSSGNHSADKISRIPEDGDRKSLSAPSVFRSDAPAFPSDSVSDDLKRLESLSSMMASVESSQPDDKKRMAKVKEETLSPPLPPPLPATVDVNQAPVPVKTEDPSHQQLFSKPSKQSRHSKVKSPSAQIPIPGNDGRLRPSPHEKKSHKKKSPLKDHQHKEHSSVKVENPSSGVVPLPDMQHSSKKERHKAEKRGAINQEGLKVKISLKQGEVKPSDSNHIVTPPLPPPPPPPAAALAAIATNQSHLKMKINRKLLESNGKGNMQVTKDIPEPKDVPKQKEPPKPTVGSSNIDFGNKKPEGLKLVISKDRISQSSHAKKQDRENRKRDRNSPKGHDPLRNSDGYQNKVARIDHQSGRGGSRNSIPLPPNNPPPLIRGPMPQGHHYPAANGKADAYMQPQQQFIMQYAQPQFYPTPHQQYFPYQGMPPGYPAQTLPQFLTNPPPPPPLAPPPNHASRHPPLPRDPPPPPPPLPPE